MGNGGHNAKLVRWGWSNYPAVDVEEVVRKDGCLHCPYCGHIDEYHVKFYNETPEVNCIRLTEGIMLTCCHHKIALLSKIFGD